MKYLYIILVAITMALTIPTSTYAEQASTTPDTVQVDVTKLTAEQLQVYQQLKALQNKSAASTAIENLTPEKVDKYAQMGKGLGIAINEGLGAVTKNVEQFAQTSAGKWIMVLVTWKVMGEDAVDLTRTLVQWIVGATLLTVGIPFWIWLIRRNCVIAQIVSVEKTSFWGRKITYRNAEPIHSDYILAYGACFVIYLGVTAAITFIH